jgi:CAAX protease family protein
VLLIRLVERRRTVELAPAAAASGLLRGLPLGIGLFAATIAVIALLGGYCIAGFGGVSGRSACSAWRSTAG